MPKFLIEPADLPSANLQLVTPISAGRGWLGLAQKAVEIAAGEPIASIKEKAGVLVVQLLTTDAAKLPQLDELRQASALICEICGEPGVLTYHQTRCGDHQGWRTSSPFPPDQRGYIEACEWEEAEPVGRELGAVEGDLKQATRDGFRQTVERSKAKLAELGVDDADLTEFVRLQLEKGRWPDSDLLEAFRTWRDQKNTSNAVPDAEN